MPAYRFRITIEEYEDLVRDIEIRPGQTLADLHQAILQSIGFKPDRQSEIAMCNDHWRKENVFEFSVLDKKKLGALVEDPHQKFLMEFDTDRPWTLYIELFRIVPDEVGASYPRLVKQVGGSPPEFRIQPTDPDLLEEDEEEVTHTEKSSKVIFSDFDESSINEEETPEGEEGEEEGEEEFNYGEEEDYGEGKFGEEEY